MLPPVALLTSLRESRDAGLPFEASWSEAVLAAVGHASSPAERVAWSDAFQDTRQGWQAAYNGSAAAPPERALVLVAADREVIDYRACGHCDEPIPAGKDCRALYCSARCRRDAHVALAA